jgi:hypothetical protein
VKTAIARSMALLVLCASTAAAADIGGQWHAQVPRGGGLTDYYFMFKVDGPKLTGMVTWAQGDSLFRLEIMEGKVSGDALSFYLLNKQGATETKMTFTGKVESDTAMAMTMERPAMMMPPGGAPPPGGAAPGAPGAAPAAARSGGAPAAPAGGAAAAPGATQVVAFTADKVNRIIAR